MAAAAAAGYALHANEFQANQYPFPGLRSDCLPACFCSVFALRVFHSISTLREEGGGNGAHSVFVICIGRGFSSRFVGELEFPFFKSNPDFFSPSHCHGITADLTSLCLSFVAHLNIRLPPSSEQHVLCDLRRRRRLSTLSLLSAGRLENHFPY